MSITPTSAIAAPNSSGCCVMLAPTSRPPFERPLIPIRSSRVQPDAASQRAQAAKSSNTFCLFASRPASCQRLAVLGAAAQRGDGEQAASLHPGQPLGLEHRAGRDLEAAVAVEQRPDVARRARRPGAGSGTAAPGCRRRRRRRPARVTKSSGSHGQRRAARPGRTTPSAIATARTVGGARKVMNVEVEGLVVPPPGEVDDHAEARQRDVDHVPPVELEHRQPVVGVVEVHGGEPVADEC